MSDDVCRLYVVGLGANLGDRRATLRSAVQALSRVGTVRAVSGLYESPAVGPPQPDYLNAAVLLESMLVPPQLLALLLEIERGHGRERRERWGARTLDLDLLHSPDLSLTAPELTLPHPELTRRPFALRPLLDVLPDASEPASGAPFRASLESLRDTATRLVERSERWDPRPDLATAGRAE